MTFQIEYEAEEKLDLEYGSLANLVGEAVLDMEDFPYEAEVNLVLTDNDEIKRINGEFRDIYAPTDVLSFPAIPFEQPADYQVLETQYAFYTNPDTEEIILGDIMISVPKILSQAEEYGHSIKREYCFLIAHSMLHLLGYDHMTPEEASVMENKQKEVLDRLNITR